MEMRRTPHQGSLSNPSTADPALAGETADRDKDKGEMERKRRKVVLRQKGSTCYRNRFLKGIIYSRVAMNCIGGRGGG